MRKVIVTGAAGFVGCNLVEALLKKGDFVYAVIRPNSPHNARLHEADRLKLVECGMQEYTKLHSLIHEPCDVFFHLAWQAGGFEDQKVCIDYYLEALDSAARIRCKRFVGIGTQAEYGPQKQLITEETCPNPITAYGASKLAACALTRQRAYELGIEWVWGRIFSLYGKYEPHGRMLPDLIRALRNGQDFQLSAATQNWDYLYSSDGAEALIALGEKGLNGEIYNVANGNYRLLKDFTEEVRKIIAPGAALFYGEELSNTTSLQASVKKIHNDTQWAPKVQFGEGIILMEQYMSNTLYV